VTGEGEGKAPSEPNPVRKEAYQHNCWCKGPQANAKDFSLLRFGEPKLSSPVTDYLAADSKHCGGSGDRREAGPEQRAPICI
jgi:hypothetical protein